MVRGFPRSAAAASRSSKTEVRVVTWETLGDFLRDEPAKVIQIMQQMSQRPAATTEDYPEACEAVADPKVSGRAFPAQESMIGA